MINKVRPRWMVVDDDAEALDIIARLLAYVSDVEVSCFKSGHDAVKAFAFAPNAFHLVITDFEMPGMNGVDVRRHLHAVAPSLRVILATGSGRFTEETALRSGFCGLLQKPFSVGALKHALDCLETHNGELRSVI
jgi:DNA-binding NtrC family response regulator